MPLLKLKITEKKRAATDAIILCLEEAGGARLSYEAGQFLTFVMYIQGIELRRSYSICSTPGVDDRLAVVIKRQPNGAVSRHIIDHVQVGEIITALPPAGRFTLHDKIPADGSYFFLAAGSGISPVYSLIKRVLHFHPQVVTLIYQNRDEESIIFRKELEQLYKTFSDRFTLIHLLSNPRGEQQFARRLNNSMLEDMLTANPSFSTHRTVFYLCGPRLFMRMAHFVIRLLGVEEQHIREEEYVIDFFPPPPVLKHHAPRQVTVRFDGQTHRFEVVYPQSILQAALKHNVMLPYSCRGGKCSTCIATCIQGKVSMSLNEVLTREDLKKGLVLTCVGYAETDVQLEI